MEPQTRPGHSNVSVPALRFISDFYHQEVDLSMLATADNIVSESTAAYNVQNVDGFTTDEVCFAICSGFLQVTAFTSAGIPSTSLPYKSPSGCFFVDFR